MTPSGGQECMDHQLENDTLDGLTALPFDVWTWADSPRNMRQELQRKVCVQPRLTLTKKVRSPLLDQNS